MAKFAIACDGNRRRKRSGARSAATTTSVATLAAAASLLGLAGATWADTTGNQGGVVGAGTILTEFLPGTPYFQPNPAATTGVDFTAVAFGYIKNEYIGVVVGQGGTYAENYSQTLTITHNVGGMITIGNTGGNLRNIQDDQEALVGLSRFELYQSSPFYPGGLQNTTGKPIGYGVWPLPSYWTLNAGSLFRDYSAYLRAQVDGATGPNNGNVGADATRTIEIPTLRNKALTSEYDISAGGATAGTVRLRQSIRLLRSMAQFTWTVTNTDAVAHTVNLRWCVPNRQNDGGPTVGNGATGTFGPRGNAYFQDPDLGVTVRRKDYITPASIPSDIYVYGRRYETDNPADPPFAARHIFRGAGATLPLRVYVGDSYEMYPTFAGFFPDPNSTFDSFINGVTTTSYYTVTVNPGSTASVVAYYGNGTATERFDNDFVTGTESLESLSFNSGAANQTGVIGNTSATLTDVGKQFLTPRPFQIYGSVYNQALNDPNFNVTLNNVNMALSLPPGLQFGINPATSMTDTPSRSLGSVRSDGNAVTSWYVEPTGDVFGAVTYQVNVSTSEFGPRAVSRIINLPAVPLRPVTADGYQMVGFPFDFDPDLSNNGDPSTIVNGLTRPVDEPVAFYQWIPDTLSLTGESGRYQLATQLQPGIGYFYRPNLNRVVFLKGARPYANQADTGFGQVQNPSQLQRVLERGWNIVANPYVYDIPLNYLSFVGTDNPSSITPQTFRDAVNAGLVRGGVFFYNTTTKSYDFFENISDPIRPFQGYWMFLNSRSILRYAQPTQRLSVVLPDPNTGTEPPTKARKNVGAIASGRAFVANPTMENWKVQLIAQNRGGATDKATLFGVSAQAKDGDDSRDLPKPPPPVEGYVYVGITKSGDKDAAPSRYAQDLKTPGGTKTWDFDVQADEDGPVTLSWPNLAKMPRRLRLQIKDKQTNKVTTLRGQSSVTVNVRKGVPSRFQFIAGPQPTTLLDITGLRAAKGGRGVGGYAFEFNVTRAATITGRVLTQNGKEVARFATGRAAEPGTLQRIAWNGRAQDGSALPTGPYLVEIQARGDEDEKVTRTQSFISLQ